VARGRSSARCVELSVRHRSWHVSVLLLVSLAGCATARNYLDPDRPVYESSFGVSRDPEAEAPHVIRVVTFNIEHGKRVLEAAEILGARSELKGADIVLLQEMQATGVEEIARRLSLNAVYYPASHHTRNDRDIGNAILSPWPIEERWKIVLPHLSRLSHHARVAVAARVRIGECRLRVYCLHIGTPINLSGGQRREQLAAVVEDARDSADPILVGGDFNSRGMAEWLAAQGFDWPTRDVGKTTTLLAFSSDHVLVRGLPPVGNPSTGVVRDTGRISDHYPVWATLRLNMDDTP
jgi:endonuclease/exonuclease/phosphatase family metal-dependent hydrolase